MIRYVQTPLVNLLCVQPEIEREGRQDKVIKNVAQTAIAQVYDFPSIRSPSQEY